MLVTEFLLLLDDDEREQKKQVEKISTSLDVELDDTDDFITEIMMGPEEEVLNKIVQKLEDSNEDIEEAVREQLNDLSLEEKLSIRNTKKTFLKGGKKELIPVVITSSTKGLSNKELEKMIDAMENVAKQKFKDKQSQAVFTRLTVMEFLKNIPLNKAEALKMAEEFSKLSGRKYTLLSR